MEQEGAGGLVNNVLDLTMLAVVRELEDLLAPVAMEELAVVEPVDHFGKLARLV